MPWWCLGSRSHRYISAALLLLATLLTGCESHDETENTPLGPETDNRAPRPLAPAVSTLTNARGMAQVTPGDLDAEQAHTFAITVPPLHGKSTVNATGLVTYAPAPGFFGIDSLAVTVTDNGQPPLSGTVSIPIVVQAHPVLSPVVTITFPGTSALLTYSPVTVRGTAQGPHPITRVAVNGVPATTTDGFATWAAAIPLGLGKNDVTVSLEDERGQTNTAAATATITRVGPFFAAPFGIAVEASGHWVVVDAQLSAIFRVDPATGTRTIVSDLSTGGGPALHFPRSIAVEASGHWVVVDAQLSAILRVDPATGIRTIVSDLSTGGGPIWSDPRGITVEASGHLAVVDEEAIIRVDPVTGTRTILSNQTIGSGPLLGNSYGVALEADGHLVVAKPGHRILVIYGALRRSD